MGATDGSCVGGGRVGVTVGGVTVGGGRVGGWVTTGTLGNGPVDEDGGWLVRDGDGDGWVIGGWVAGGRNGESDVGAGVTQVGRPPKLDPSGVPSGDVVG